MQRQELGNHIETLKELGLYSETYGEPLKDFKLKNGVVSFTSYKTFSQSSVRRWLGIRRTSKGLLLKFRWDKIRD